MTSTLNGNITKSDEILSPELPEVTNEDWSEITKESLDSLPQVWTRGRCRTC